MGRIWRFGNLRLALESDLDGATLPSNIQRAKGLVAEVHPQKREA